MRFSDSLVKNYSDKDRIRFVQELLPKFAKILWIKLEGSLASLEIRCGGCRLYVEVHKKNPGWFIDFKPVWDCSDGKWKSYHEDLKLLDEIVSCFEKGSGEIIEACFDLPNYGKF